MLQLFYTAKLREFCETSMLYANVFSKSWIKLLVFVLQIGLL